jgi:hypothetical protein
VESTGKTEIANPPPKSLNSSKSAASATTPHRGSPSRHPKKEDQQRHAQGGEWKPVDCITRNNKRNHSLLHTKIGTQPSRKQKRKATSSSAWDRTRNLPVASSMSNRVTAERATNCATEDLLCVIAFTRLQFIIVCQSVSQHLSKCYLENT